MLYCIYILLCSDIKFSKNVTFRLELLLGEQIKLLGFQRASVPLHSDNSCYFKLLCSLERTKVKEQWTKALAWKHFALHLQLGGFSVCIW